MIDETQIDDVIGRHVYGSDGEKIGRAGQVFLDDETGHPEWVTVRTGLFGMNESFVPLRSAAIESDRLTVPYDKDVVKDAPNVNPDSGHLSVEKEDTLYRYYGMSGDDQSGRPDVEHASGLAPDERHTRDELASDDELHSRDEARRDDATGRDVSGPSDDDAMTRSAERLQAGTQRRETGRFRLRKYVTTEQRTVTVPVIHEEVRVEREPVTEDGIEQDDADTAASSRWQASGQTSGGSWRPEDSSRDDEVERP